MVGDEDRRYAILTSPTLATKCGLLCTVCYKITTKITDQLIKSIDDFFFITDTLQIEIFHTKHDIILKL